MLTVHIHDGPTGDCSMRVRATVFTTLATAAILTPFAAPAGALTTTSTQIVYAADLDGDDYYELYTMPADGSTDGTQLFATTTDVAFPALSFDGTKLAYVDDVDDVLTYHLMVRAANGSGSATQLTTGDDASPAWSRDGSTIAYAHYNEATGTTDVYTIPAAGGTPTLVAANADEPAFSPSGRQLVVDHLGSAGDYAGLDVVTLDGGNRSRVSGTGTGSNGAYSPDGHWIVFETGTFTAASCRVTVQRVPSGGAAAATPVFADSTSFFMSPEFSRDGTQLFASQLDSPCAAVGTPPGDVVAATWNDGALSAPLTVADVRTTAGVTEGAATVAGGTPAADTTAPAAPAGLAATVGATSVTLSWTADADATEYYVLRTDHGAPAPLSPTGGTVAYHGGARSATISGLSANTSYDYWVFAYDAAGNLSAVSAAKAAKTTPVPVLATIPKVGVATTGATFPITWTGTAPTYDLLVGEKTKSSAGVWSLSPVYKTWKAGTATKSWSYAGAQGHTYYVQVRGRDVYGNPTALTAAKTANVPLNENWAGFTYSTGWTAVASATRYGGEYKYATAASKTISTKVDTSSFAVIGDKCATCGSFKVYVDGVLKATISSYAGATATRQVLYQGGSFGSVKAHTIKIVTSGTAGHPRVDIDAVALTR
jgi:hypothetical protein